MATKSKTAAASAPPPGSSLPCKKRKASNASSSISSTSGGGRAGSGGGGGSSAAAVAEQAHQSQQHAARATRRNSARLREKERRLPSKKRKGSHADTMKQQQRQQQKQQQAGNLLESSSSAATAAAAAALESSADKAAPDAAIPPTLPAVTATGCSRKGSFLDFLEDSVHPVQEEEEESPEAILAAKSPTNKASGATAADASAISIADKAPHDSLLETVADLPELSNSNSLEQQKQEENNDDGDDDDDDDGSDKKPAAASKVKGLSSSAMDHLDALKDNEHADTAPEVSNPKKRERGDDSKVKDGKDKDEEEKKPAANDADDATVKAKTGNKSSSTTTSGNSKNNKQHDDQSSNGDETFASSGHRLLMEAIMMSGAAATASDSAGSSSAAMKLENLPKPAPVHSSSRDRLDSFPPGGGATNSTRDRLDSFPPPGGVGRDRLDSGASARDRPDSIGQARDRLGRGERLDSFGGGGGSGAGGRDRLDSFAGMARERLESWGGMSDLSVPPPPVDASLMASAMAAASSLQHGHFLLDGGGSGDQNSQSHQDSSERRQQQQAATGAAIPSRISLQRDRFNSIASLSEFSASGALHVDGIDLNGGDLQAFVAAAMASVGNQISDLAGVMENVVAAAAAGSLASLDGSARRGDESDEGSSAASAGGPMIGAMPDSSRRPRSWSTSSKIAVDLDAVQAAVAAAEAASGSLGLPGTASREADEESDNRKMAPPPAHKVTSLSVKPAAKGGRSRVVRRTLPLKRSRAESQTSSDDGNHPPETKRRATKAKSKSVPLKKRGKRNSPVPSSVKSTKTMPTPKISNRSIAASAGLQVVPPFVPSSAVVAAPKPAAPRSSVALEKWESMYSALLDFKEERRAIETKKMSSNERKHWEWDGNVPTNYKTKDGKPLGRWINNQRSAFNKGKLKEDREQRLMNAGLKWSVATSKNPWDCMFKELTIYVGEQTSKGKSWDGNVPTNYTIKKRADDKSEDDKNLGRWVNRQRSSYQAGKLRKERQLALEKLGLKWSMQFTTTWDEMFETLEEYVKEQKKNNKGVWDGNVPTQFRTGHDPPRSLGRWVNRQRSNRSKKKLKKEYEDKLTALGMVWCMHKHAGNEVVDDDDIERESEELNEKGGGNLSGKENVTKAESIKPQEDNEPVEAPTEPKMDVEIGETAVI